MEADAASLWFQWWKNFCVALCVDLLVLNFLCFLLYFSCPVILQFVSFMLPAVC